MAVMWRVRMCLLLTPHHGCTRAFHGIESESAVAFACHGLVVCLQPLGQYACAADRGCSTSLHFKCGSNLSKSTRHSQSHNLLSKHTSTTGTQHTTTDNKHSATRPCFFQAWTQLYVYVCVCRPNSMGLPKIMAATTHPHCCVFGQCVHLCSTLTQCSAISCSLSGLMGVCAGAATADT